MGSALKSLRLLSLLPTRPGEFLDRTAAIFATRWESSRDGKTRRTYRTVGQDEGLRTLLEHVGAEAQQYFCDAGLTEIQDTVRERQRQLPTVLPFASSHNGDSFLARLCYLLVRALRATSVLETGVCYGVTSAHILQALDLNGIGHLHSIDLPPLSKSADEYVGWVVPSGLRERWSLYRGSSARVLRPLLADLGQIDLFIHDSLHTYRNMKMEFGAVWPCLRPGGMLISDDVEGNVAFLELSQQEDVALSLVVDEVQKPALLGIAIKSA